MVYEMTIQVRVTDIEKGKKWYEKLFQRKPDFEPHFGIVEWEIFPGSWLQLAEGTPAKESGPLRFGVKDIKDEQQRVMEGLDVEHFKIHSREEVPVKWGTFSDPWGNQLGFYEYHDKAEQEERIQTIAGKA
ncbi:VOC family protein [Halobacillus sp. BBL2006]|uniref:VOC family protein n=1 Tax=Halobacillus sp. BBL2006 TaxID=1543706 RepID=UPI0005432314|nr:VOC family protein [Halobacillus sp. BBL2006]KHE72444.1 ornithine monooxygenase [Halobacillus sp. BBL2006]